MTIAFDRPVGAPADVKELEYISALYQTQANELRSNASVTGTYHNKRIFLFRFIHSLSYIVCIHLSLCLSIIQPKTFRPICRHVMVWMSI
jgi:hypothetical protein